MSDQPNVRRVWSRRDIVAAGAAAALLGTLPLRAGADAPPKKLEKPALNLGIASLGSNFLPVYVAAARTWKAQGLDVHLVAFRGDSEVAQALAGNSIDISLASMNGLINMITAGQSVAAFYAGFDQADFAWLAQPSIKTWADLKAKKIGVSTFGSLTDALTRYALKTHGIDPERDVDIIQAGAAQAAFQALESGTINAAILSPPFKWRAAEAGYTVLGTQAHDIAPRWPKNLFMARTDLIAANPNTIEAFLRAHVDAIRFARADRNAAIAIIVDQLKFTPADAARAYDSAMDGIDERGNLPEAAMPTFWKVTVANGDVDKPWPESKFLDRRFIDTFSRWALGPQRT
jgi:NitT/TauT family transport system substrate-binding protein